MSSSSANFVCHYKCFCKPSLTVRSEQIKMPDLNWPRKDRRDYLFRPTIYGSQELIAGTAASFKARGSIYKPECPPTRLSLPFAPLLTAAAGGRATPSSSIIAFKKSNQHPTEHALTETSFKFSTAPMNIFNAKYSA